MKASEFVKFFNFTLRRNEGFTDENRLFRYEVTDDEGTLQTRYVAEVSELVDQFDVCLKDYIDGPLLDFGFMPEGSSELGFYGQALKFINEGDGADLIGTQIHKVIECICDSDKIEDDVTGDNSENVRGFVYDFFAELYKYAPNTIELLVKNEGKSIENIAEIIIDLGDTDSIGGKEDIEALYATFCQQMETQDDILTNIHRMLEAAALYEG